MYPTVGPNLWIHSGALKLENFTAFSDNRKGMMIADYPWLIFLFFSGFLGSLVCQAVRFFSCVTSHYKYYCGFMFWNFCTLDTIWSWKIFKSTSYLKQILMICFSLQSLFSLLYFLWIFYLNTTKKPKGKISIMNSTSLLRQPQEANPHSLPKDFHSGVYIFTYYLKEERNSWHSQLFVFLSYSPFKVHVTVLRRFKKRKSDHWWLLIFFRM